MQSTFITGLLLVAWCMKIQANPMRVDPINFITGEDNNASSAASVDKAVETEPCEPLDIDDVERRKKGNMFVVRYNTTLLPSENEITVENRTICFDRSDRLKDTILKECEKWEYEDYEFTKLSDGSVLLFDLLLEPGTFEIKNDKLLACSSDDVDYPISTGGFSVGEAQIYIGKIGSSISILALAAHLTIFCVVPTLRTLPGYNLASLSVAFLFAYSFVIIGQIPEVLGTFCVVSGAFQQNFFLVAFFCSNVMAFDIWKTLKSATTKLTVSSKVTKKKEFVFYSLYAWGVPAIITSMSLVADYTDVFPDWTKPKFGNGDLCWITNLEAKLIFFTIPALTLFIINGIFFTLSAIIIKRNTMKNTSDLEQQANRLNFVLFVRLGIMMGVTWSISVVAMLVNMNWLWIVFDVFNSLQGLFVFLLFSCSRKVAKLLRERMSIRLPKISTEKQVTSTTKTESH